jgi:hypothetical protein
VVEQESRDLVEYLRSLGKEVEYLMFPNEGHDVLKFENRVTCYNAITEFFQKYLNPYNPTASFDLNEKEEMAISMITDQDRTHAPKGDLALLAGPRQKHFIVRLKQGEALETHRGILKHDELIGLPWGSMVYSHLGRHSCCWCLH